jgi:hypothetical protein
MPASRSELLGKLADLLPDAPTEAQAKAAKEKADADAREQSRRSAGGAKPTRKSITVPVAGTEF